MQRSQAPRKEAAISMAEKPSSLLEAAHYALLRRLAPSLRHRLMGDLQPVTLLAELAERQIAKSPPDLEKTRAAPNESLTAREDGPLWYRGLAQEPETFEPQLTEILTAQKARAIVVAHTVAPTGRITARFGGRVFMIDTGMQPAYVEKGRPSALEIRGQVFTAIYRDSREVVAGGGQLLAAR